MTSGSGSSPFCIALAGASSTGKTTLMKNLVTTLPKDLRISLIQGITRSIITDGFPLGKNSTVDSYIQYILRQFREERRVMAQGAAELVISDRTLLDGIGYARANRELPRPFVQDYVIEMLEEAWLAEASRYDLYIFFPTEIPFVDDGVRDNDMSYREKVSDEILAALERSGVPFLSVSGSVEQRVTQVSERLPFSTARSKSVSPLPKNANLWLERVESLDDDARGAEKTLRDAGFSDIIDHTLFQRLKGVSFLGVADLCHSGATYSRFEHSVGVGGLSLHLADKVGIVGEERDAFVFANLIHDLRHAPFSHNAEPFLVETNRIYHKGLLARTLRAPPSQPESVFRGRSEAFAAAVRALLITPDPLLHDHELMMWPLRCDKLDGNWRTQSCFGMPQIDRMSLINAVQIDEAGAIGIPDKWLDQIERFWSLEREMYSRHLCTSAVYAREAVFTRALYHGFGSDYELTDFSVLDDRATLTALVANSSAAQLVDALFDPSFSLSPLSRTHPELSAQFAERIREHRFNLDARFSIEREIATALGLSDGVVVSHFSMGRSFLGDRILERQKDLFSVGVEELITADSIKKSFSQRKTSGEYFEIFHS